MFSLVYTLTSLPGSCVNCGSGLKPPYVDLGISVDFLGSIVLCHECVEEAGRLVGMIDEKHHTENLAKIVVQDVYITSVEQENKALRNVIENANVANYGSEMMVVLGTSDSDSNSIDGDFTLDFDVVEDDEASSGSTELVDSGEGTPDESSDDKRVDKLRPSKSESADFNLRI
jgi:hypothetical protein